MSTENKDSTILKRMKKCQHLMVITGINNNRKNIITYTCLKCGLKNNNKSANISTRLYHQLQNIFFETKTQKTDIDVYCELPLAQAIYAGIIKAHPGINDELVADYFRVALYMIRKYEMSSKKEQSRIRRLNLPPEFNNWR